MRDEKRESQKNPTHHDDDNNNKNDIVGDNFQK